MSNKSNSEKVTTSLAKFTIGPLASIPSYIYVCDGHEDVLFKGDTYKAEPTMEIRLGERTLGFDDKSTTITINTDENSFNQSIRDFATAVSAGRAYPPTDVVIYEIVGDGADYQRTMASGRIVSAIRNKGGVKGAVEITIRPKKGLADKASGLPVTHQCQAPFGGFGCFKDISGLIVPDLELVWYSAPESHDVYIRPAIGDPQAAAKQSIILGTPWWEHGYVEKDGLTIGIREQFVGSNRFVLNQQPPTSWNTATDVTLYPGCSGTIEDCLQRANSVNFQGVGYAIPAYNPVFEDGNL